MKNKIVAAISENVCAAKMSRYIREKKQIGDYCYVTVIHTANSATTSANALSNPYTVTIL